MSEVRENAVTSITDENRKRARVILEFEYAGADESTTEQVRVALASGATQLQLHCGMQLAGVMGQFNVAYTTDHDSDPLVLGVEPWVGSLNPAGALGK